MMLTGPLASDTPVVSVLRSLIPIVLSFPDASYIVFPVRERWLMPGSVRVP